MFIPYGDFPFHKPELLAVRRFAWSEPYAWRLPMSLWLEILSGAYAGGWRHRVSRRQARAMRRAIQRGGAALGTEAEEALRRMLAGGFTLSKIGGAA